MVRVIVMPLTVADSPSSHNACFRHHCAVERGGHFSIMLCWIRLVVAIFFHLITITTTTMPTVIHRQAVRKQEISELKIKAQLFDELLELIEDKYLGRLMRLTEKEKNIPLAKAKKLLR